MKQSLICTVLLCLLAMGMGSKKPNIPLPPPETEIAAPSVPAGEGFQVAFKSIPGFATDKQAALIEKASFKLNETVKGPCFAKFITEATLKETSGRTNAEVLSHLLSFRDTVPVKMYFNKWSSAVAYRQPPEKKINLNGSYFNESKSICRWAATMAHESLGHSLGNYGHSSSWNINREYTVPYKIGGASEKYGSNAFDACCKD